MYKRLIFCLCLMLAICFLGCSRYRNGTVNIDNGTENLTELTEHLITLYLSQWAEIYQITLESYLAQDTALNENIEFIAIDFSTLELANDDDKKQIVIWFEKKYMPVIDTNLDGLREEGLFDEDHMYIPNGVLLTIEKVTEGNNEIIIQGMKYRGGRAANWFETKWLFNNRIWEFNETIMTGIS